MKLTGRSQSRVRRSPSSLAGAACAGAQARSTALPGGRRAARTRADPGRLPEGGRHLRRSWRRSSASRSPAATRRSGRAARSAGSGTSRSACAATSFSGRAAGGRRTSTPSVTGAGRAATTRVDRPGRRAADRRGARSASSTAFRSASRNVGGIDAARERDVRARAVDASDVAVSLPDGSLKLGYGARLGLLQESLVDAGRVVHVPQARPADDEHRRRRPATTRIDVDGPRA